MANTTVYEYSNNENEVEQPTNEELRLEELTPLVRRTYLARPNVRRRKQMAIATRKANALQTNLAEAKHAAVGLNVARKTQAYNALGMDIEVPSVELQLAGLNQNDPYYLELFQGIISSHEQMVQNLKRQTYGQMENATLRNLRTNTNASYADFAKKIPTVPKAARPAYVLLAKMDDLYGKVVRNLTIASTKEERKRLASKKYDIGKLRTLINKVISNQARDPTYPIPPGLQRQISEVFVGEDVAALLSPTVPVANRLPAAITAFETEREGRYRTLKNQMNAMKNNSNSRERVTFLAAIEEAIALVSSQDTNSNAAEAAVTAELAMLNELKQRVTAAIAAKTPIALPDKVKLIKLLRDYGLSRNSGNGLYSRLNANRRTFNMRNLSAQGAAAVGSMVPNLPAPAPAPARAFAAPLSPEERRARAARAAAAAAARAGAPQGGKRRTHKRKN